MDAVHGEQQPPHHTAAIDRGVQIVPTGLAPHPSSSRVRILAGVSDSLRGTFPVCALYPYLSGDEGLGCQRVCARAFRRVVTERASSHPDQV